MTLLSNLLSNLPTYTVIGELDPSLEITQIATDSRRVQAGALFIAYEGWWWTLIVLCLLLPVRGRW